MVPLRTGMTLATNHSSSSADDPEPSAFWTSRYAIGLLVLGAIVTYFLLCAHRAHFIGALPFLLLLVPALLWLIGVACYLRESVVEPAGGVN